MTEDTRLESAPLLESAAASLRSALSPATGFALPRAGDAETASIELIHSPGLDAEAYRLEVTQARVTIAAATPAGAFYGVQTLRQLLPTAVYSADFVDGVDWKIPAVVIADSPRFAWRGMHLDVGRHFMPVEFVLRFIDALAMHKMNRFHWHLTEDQGWRIEIRKYPRLTEVGAWRAESERMFLSSEMDGTPHGGFYTQEEIRRIVAYAAERHVTIVPEIEMPGHAQAAIAAYPELGNTGVALPVRTRWGVNEHILNTDESTILFLQEVLAEVVELFPGPYVHLGGDEVPKDEWEASARVQAQIAELGLEDERALQAWFFGRMEEFLSGHGRRMVGWDEILQGGTRAKQTVVMSWRGVEPGIRAARAGYDVVMAPTSPTYFDYLQSGNDDEPPAIPRINRLADVYAFDPLPEGLGDDAAARVLGAQGQLWTELMPTPDHVSYMAFPRTAALAEVLWLEPEQKDYSAFRQRLDRHLERLDRMGLPFRAPGNDALTWGDRIVQRLYSAAEWVYYRLSAD